MQPDSVARHTVLQALASSESTNPSEVRDGLATALNEGRLANRESVSETVDPLRGQVTSNTQRT